MHEVAASFTGSTAVPPALGSIASYELEVNAQLWDPEVAWSPMLLRKISTPSALAKPTPEGCVLLSFTYLASQERLETPSSTPSVTLTSGFSSFSFSVTLRSWLTHCPSPPPLLLGGSLSSLGNPGLLEEKHMWGWGLAHLVLPHPQCPPRQDSSPFLSPQPTPVSRETIQTQFWALLWQTLADALSPLPPPLPELPSCRTC